MRLSKLKLAGFKSFVDPTLVLTPGQLVGVVGPNGCGKSNIIDAVRWVLGESRASALRGDSMQDVIFNGSSERKPVSRASVELVFDNHQGKLAGQWGQYAEIAVKRVLDRSGESSYFINGLHVRRKDVIDLFLGTGLGPRAYAIIEQGMISRIIEARPEDVRAFLEEAAGITKYKERRRETEGRLADARDNLVRIEDIRAELAGQVDRLRRQAEVAEHYRRLQAQLTERQGLLWLLRLTAAQAEAESASTRAGELEGQLVQAGARLVELEAAATTRREAHLAAGEAVNLAQADYYAAGAEVSRCEAELRQVQERAARLDARLAQLQGEHADWLTRVKQAQAELERWDALHEAASLRHAQAQARHDALQERLPAAEQASSASEAQAQEARRALSLAEQQLRVEETRRASGVRALAGLAERRARLERERAALTVPEAAVLTDLEARHVELEQALTEAHAALQRQQNELPALQQALRAAQEAENAARRELTEVRARAQALTALQRRLSQQGPAGDWLRRYGFDGAAPLWQQIQIEPGWEAALEAVLRERLAALEAPDAQALAAALADEPPSGAAFLLPLLAPADAAAIPCPLGEPLMAKLQAEPMLRARLQTWLAGVGCVDELAPWLTRSASLPAGCALVTRRGEVLMHGVLSLFAPDARSHGALERQRELEALQRVVAEAEGRLTLAVETARTAEAALADAQQVQADLRREVQLLQSRQHSEQVALLTERQAHARHAELLARLAHEAEELARAEQGEQVHLARAECEVERQGELLATLAQQLELACAARAQTDASTRELRAAEQTTARALQEASFSLRECEARRVELMRNRGLAQEQLTKLDTERVHVLAEREGQDFESLQAGLQDALRAREAREHALAGRRDALEGATAALRETDEARLRCEREQVPLRDALAQLRMQVQAAQLAAAQAQARLDEAGADPQTLRPLLGPELKEAALGREIARLTREIGDLGAVNLAALAELQEASTRKDYLDAQYADLMQAIDTLEDAIRRIDRDTREQLQETYNTVNRHFGELFPQLFGGGEARLELSGEEILDAGVQIVARPPGKKNSSIHLLSGGEKALTAIALVFSFFQLNPAPFCMLDEVDAPLDDANTGRYCEMVRRMSAITQFIFISHSKITMEIAEQLVGVTMQEQGVSRVVEVDIDAAMRMAEQTAA